MLDIYEMQVFLTAAETESFSEAGRRLQMSQPAVSMQIKSLEKRLNVELFQRSGRNIRLTEIGQVLVPMARELVSKSVHIEEAVAALKGETIGVLRISCSTTAGKYVLPKLIGSFIEQYPAVEVVCNVGSRGTALESLLKGDAHLAITSLREPSKDLEYRHFMVDPVVLIAPVDHPWARRKSIEIEELPEGKYIRREVGSGTNETVAEALAAYEIGLNDLPTAMILGNSEAIYMAVAEGIGVAFISYSAAADGMKTGHVVEVPIVGLDMAQQLYMVRHTQHTMTSALVAFWNHVFAPINDQILGREPAL
jgi:DNA-binding transcriptional LysR family regulator